jgi:hypothetical protein
MDQRQALRFESDQPVTVSILSASPVTRCAVIRNVSGLGLGPEMEAPVASGAAVKIEFEDSLLLGEVVYTRALENSMLMGVRLREGLRGLREMARASLEYAGAADRAR